MFQFKKYNPGEHANHHNRLKEEAEKAKNQTEKAENETDINVKTDEVEKVDKVHTDVKSETDNVEKINEDEKIETDNVEKIDTELTNEVVKTENQTDNIDQTDNVKTEHVETTNGTGGKTSNDPEDESKPEHVPKSEVEGDAAEKAVE